MPIGEIDMTAEAARVEECAEKQTEAGAPDDQERAVERIAQLLSAGCPISEILDAAKRFAVQANAAQPNGSAERGKLTFRIVGKSCTGASNQETALTVPFRADLGQEVVGSVAVLDRNTNAALGAGPSDGQQSLEAAPLRGAWRSRSFGLLRSMIFWLVPALSLAVLVTAGKISIDAGVVQKAADALAAIAGTVPSGENEPLSSAATAAASVVVEPDRAEPQRAEPDRAEPRLTPEEIKTLLDRGDALVSMADIASARLFYERAAAVGNAEAAVRLGATYDADFLAQLRHMGRDRTIAQYWYQRARDLEAKPTGGQN
jgi:hypothetical protein